MWEVVGHQGEKSLKLTKTLSYNVSGTLSWTQLDSLGPSFAPTRASASVNSRVAPGGTGSSLMVVSRWVVSQKERQRKPAK